MVENAAQRGKAKSRGRFARWGKYASIAAFMFFLIKGLVWLAVGGLALWGFTR
jgi:hypothetical protein